MGKKYINMNVELRKGGRNAVKMSIDEFKNEMEHTYKEYAMEMDLDVSSSCYKKPSVGHFVYNCCYDNKNNKKISITKALHKDIWEGKYHFDSENVENRGDVKISKKGVPYIECYAGGDWECPVCFFVYYDGHKFRGYIPLKGNAINRDNNSAFQGDPKTEESFIRKELGIKKDEDCPLSCGNVDYNIDACLEDFMSRIEVKGSYKKHDYSKDDEKFEDFKKKKIEEKKQRDLEREQKQNCNVLHLTESDLKNIIKEIISYIL